MNNCLKHCPLLLECITSTPPFFFLLPSYSLLWIDHAVHCLKQLFSSLSFRAIRGSVSNNYSHPFCFLLIALDHAVHCLKQLFSSLSFRAIWGSVSNNYSHPFCFLLIALDHAVHWFCPAYPVHLHASQSSISLHLSRVSLICPNNNNKKKKKNNNNFSILRPTFASRAGNNSDSLLFKS